MSVPATWWCQHQGTGGHLHRLAVLWFHMLGSGSVSVPLRMYSPVSLSSSTCAVFPLSSQSPYTHSWVAPGTSKEVMFYCTCWPLLGTPRAYCCCFAIRSVTCPSAILPRVISSALRCRASTSLWNGLWDLRRGGFLCFVMQSYRRLLGLLVALVIVLIVAALRQSLGGAMPASTGKLSTGVTRRQLLMVRKAMLRQVSSFRQWLLHSDVGAQY